MNIFGDNDTVTVLTTEKAFTFVHVAYTFFNVLTNQAKIMLPNIILLNRQLFIVSVNDFQINLTSILKFDEFRANY